MRSLFQRFSILLLIAIFSLVAFGTTTALAAKPTKAAKAEKADEAKAAFDADKMGDMTGFDPANIVQPTGDTIKIGLVASFSGPSAINGQIYWLVVNWVAYDLNMRGGIMVDGKKKLIEVIKGDHMGKVDQCKKVLERLALQEKVHVFWGTDGSHMMRLINSAADKYKIIAINATSMSDDLQDAGNFSRYAFQAAFSTEQIARAFAYYYGQIRKKETKFYILNQDYAFGREYADSFKKGLKEYYPTATIVGEDYHKLFLTDYAPYLTKVKASGAEVIFSGDWLPDAGNLLKQARQMGVMLPIANVYFDDPNMLNEVGIEGTKGLVNISSFWTANPQFKSAGYTKAYKAWNNQWKTTWKTAPYNGKLFEHYFGNFGSWTSVTYWLFSVMERAKSTDADKMVAVWENDSYKYVNGKVVKMRACDHKVVQDLTVVEFVTPDQQKVHMNIAPFYWYKTSSSYGPAAVIPADKIVPWMDTKLERCK